MFEKQSIRNCYDFRTAPEITEIPDVGIFAYINKKGYLYVYVDGHEYYDCDRKYRPVLYARGTEQEIYIPTKTCIPKEVKDNYKTELAWAKLGYKVIPNAEPWLMFSSPSRTETTTDYYRIDQVEKIKNPDRYHENKYLCTTGEQRPKLDPTDPWYALQQNLKKDRVW